MDKHTLKTLEFDAIREMLQERVACELGAEQARLMEPVKDIGHIRHLQQETSEARHLLQSEGRIPLGGIQDIRPSLERARLAAMLSPQELMDIADTLSSSRRLRQFLLRPDRSPLLSALTEPIGDFRKLEEAIRRCIGNDGEVLDSASEKLARIRSRIKVTHSRILEKLNAILASTHYRTMIQEPIITLRDDRYCIPVKTDSRSQFGGLVHDQSASGATVFMEPTAVLELGNEHRQLRFDERDEIERILRMLALEVGEQSPGIAQTLEILAHVDFTAAKAALSCDLDCAEPVLNREGYIDIRQGRHPLLSGEVVPIDMRLGKGYTTLLITGPNTGGKTVTLKTVGLFVLMAQSGLHIPAQNGSQVAVLDQVFADIGDEQSIQQSLSTFSSHIIQIVRILREMNKNSLVLLDEVGAGTDPTEGAALARSLLDFLTNRGALVIATTHYGELKEFAYMREGVENASVEFDIRTLRPTYRILMGIPGSSNALIIASRLGMPEEVIAAAREYVGTGNLTADQVIRSLVENQRQAEEERRLAAEASRDARILRDRYETKLRSLQERHDEIVAQAQRDSEAVIREATEQANALINQLRQSGQDTKGAEAVRQALHETARKVRSRRHRNRPEHEERPVDLSAIKPGMPVMVTTLGRTGVLQNPPGGSEDAVVMIGAIKVNVSFAALRPVEEEEKAAGARRRESPGTSDLRFEKAKTIAPEIHILGMTVQEALERVEKYLDDAIIAGVPEVRIVHGKGTGALRRGIWNFLKERTDIHAFRIGEKGEGGEGATIVQFEGR
ncbi:MAG: endonuclease MutS2 [Armatimonadetes bacterium]|nr:endonuclease MutS2 [Armatimonadota bacterium]